MIMNNLHLAVLMGILVAVLSGAGLAYKTGQTLIGGSGEVGGGGGIDGGCSTCCDGAPANGIYSYDGERVHPKPERVKLILQFDNGIVNTRYNVTCSCCSCNSNEKCENCNKSGECDDGCPLAGTYRHRVNLIDPVSKVTIQPVQAYVELDHTGTLGPKTNLTCDGGVWYCSGISDCRCPQSGTAAYVGAHLDPQTGEWKPVTLVYRIGPKGKLILKNIIVYPLNPACPYFG